MVRWRRLGALCGGGDSLVAGIHGSAPPVGEPSLARAQALEPSGAASRACWAARRLWSVRRLRDISRFWGRPRPCPAPGCVIGPIAPLSRQAGPRFGKRQLLRLAAVRVRDRFPELAAGAEEEGDRRLGALIDDEQDHVLGMGSHYVIGVDLLPRPAGELPHGDTL